MEPVSFLTREAADGYNPWFVSPEPPTASGQGGNDLYAIIQSGGKQYHVTEGARLNLERLKGKVGQEVSFDEVLLVGGDDSVQVGQPMLQGAQVVGTIVDQGKGDKILVFKMKRRKMYRRKRGHRQLFTQVQIDKIAVGSKKTESKKAASTETKAASKPKTGPAAKAKAAGGSKSESTPATKKPGPAKARTPKSAPAKGKDD